MAKNKEEQPHLFSEPSAEYDLTPEEQARKEEYQERLRQHLQDPEFRQIPGFPMGDDEAILALSDPPYYTACPNPFIEDFDKAIYSNTDKYQRLPYSGDIETSTNNLVYAAHSYHTKVPPDIISTLIDHYCNSGDLILDVFSGTGMTGVAAAELDMNCILIDLSPLASFISWVNSNVFPDKEAIEVFTQIVNETEHELGYLYETLDEKGSKGTLNYVVWSDVFTCPYCDYEFPFFPHGVEHLNKKVKTKKTFPCPSCNADLNVRTVERVITALGNKKKQLVWVNAKYGNKYHDRPPTKFDLELAEKVEHSKIHFWYPMDEVNPDWYSARLGQLGHKKITSVDKFLSKRNLWIYSALFSKINVISDDRIRAFGIYVLTGVFTVISEHQGYFGGGGGMSGNLYMPIIRKEQNIFFCIRRRIAKIKKAEVHKKTYTGKVLVSTQSATNLKIPDNSIDYIYTDPPFGANIIYSEMNSILEAWLRVKTNNTEEAVINDFQRKEIGDYHNLMFNSFSELFRVLKPGRWITVEFHNTQASIWNVIQESLGRAGFIVAQTGTLDKGSSTILQDIRPGAVNNDIIISAYKPSSEFSREFTLVAGSDEGVWIFVRAYLENLPITLITNDGLKFINERQPRILFDRMVAFHIQNGFTIPLSASEFYLGLINRFIERDGMVFLPNQIPEYDSARLQVSNIMQMTYFVEDEKSAIIWLKGILDPKLNGQPQIYQDVLPKFLQHLHQAPHEILPELGEILEQNFLLNENGEWYVPDPNKLIDLEKIRNRTLLREFNSYLDAKGELNQLRTEAVRVGFADAWRRKDFEIIVKVANRLPEAILQEDPDLLMYYDNASLRVD